MRITLTTEGGLAYFPGLSQPVVLDSRDLSIAEVADLDRLINSARFFDLPENSRALPGCAADYQQYTITIERGERCHTIHLTDSVENPRLQMLLDFLRHHAKQFLTTEGAAQGQAR